MPLFMLRHLRVEALSTPLTCELPGFPAPSISGSQTCLPLLGLAKMCRLVGLLRPLPLACTTKLVRTSRGPPVSPE